MTLQKVIDQYTKWFHILGQSYLPFHGNDCLCVCGLYRVLRYMPCVIVLSVTFFLTVSKIMIILVANKYSYAGTATVVFDIISYVLPVFISVPRSLLHSSNLTILLEQIDSFEKLSRKGFTFDLPAFHRNYRRQLSINFAVHILPILIRSIILRTFFFVSALLRALAFLPACYVLFYANLFNLLLRSFAQYVESQANTNSTVLGNDTGARYVTLLRSELHYYKIIYFKLWRIAETINTVFGWTLVAIFIQNFFMALMNVHFMLLGPGKQHGISEGIRKYRVYSAL